MTLCLSFYVFVCPLSVSVSVCLLVWLFVCLCVGVFFCLFIWLLDCGRSVFKLSACVFVCLYVCVHVCLFACALVVH